MDNAFNDINDIYDDLQRLLQEINRLRTTNRNAYPRTRTRRNEESILFLRELLQTYNANIREYQENMRFMMQLMSLLLDESHRNTAPNTRHRPRYAFNDVYYRYFPNIEHNRIGRAANWFNQNVIVAPTQEQIDAATANYEYSSETAVNNTNCPITLDEFQEGEQVIRIEHCGHTFRRDAIQNWFQGNVRCPVCRYDIREFTQPSQDETIPTQRTPERSLSDEDIYNSLRSSITNSLSDIINEYYSTTDASQNLVYTFEFPIYTDLSNNPFRSTTN
jgi:hypothetical protein